MKAENINDIIPEQQKGAKTDTEHTVSSKNAADARRLFDIGCERLQDVNNWHQICGPASATFKLTDNDGNEINRKPQPGDHFKIGVPAPGTSAGEGHDWVIIEAIEDKRDPSGNTEAFAIRVRPAQNPDKPGDEIAHFFKDDATSSFAVQREGNTVTASVHGRNEMPNTKTESVLDKARNAVVALGAMVGLSNPQWKSLVKGILEE